MSKTGKSSVRQVLESMSPLKLVKPKLTPEAATIKADAVTVFRDAVKDDVKLDGRLAERRDNIERLAAGKQYDLARTQLESFRRDVDVSIGLKKEAALYVDVPGMTPDETVTAGLLRRSVAEDIDKALLAQAADEIRQLSTVIAGAQMRADLGLDFVADIIRSDVSAALPAGATPDEEKDAQALRDGVLRELGGDLTAEKVEKAREMAKSVVSARAAVQRRLDVSGADPQARYDRLAMRVRDVTGYPAGYRSEAVTRLCAAVDAANGTALTKLQAVDGAAPGAPRETAEADARTAVDALRVEVEKASTALSKHDKEARAYFAALKTLTPQIKLADGLGETNPDGTDTAWKAERRAYDTSRAKLVGFQDDKKFLEANAELALCRTAIDALLAKRRVPIDAAVAAAADDTPAARTVVQDLAAGQLLAILTPQQQLALLRKLPVSAENEQARIKLFENPAMDPAFVKAEATVLRDVVRTLRGDDGPSATAEARQAKKEWEEHERNWAAWAGKDPKRPRDKNLKKIQAFFQKTAEMQFTKLIGLAGLDPADLPPGFPKPPVKVKLAELDPSDFGETTPVFPAEIIMNSKHRSFENFKEMIDTIMHENAHAWQNMVVAMFNGVAPFRPADTAKVKGPTASPAMKVQAELFAQNDTSYFNTADSRDAYRHEPLEEQAWTFGGNSALALLVPPQPRSFDSAKGFKNKFWAVSSLSRTATAQVRLRERHGLNVDVWKGERARDKKLTLEGVPGLPANRAIRVRDVTDEYTLELDLDASALRGRVVPAAEVRVEMEARASSGFRRRKLADLTDEQRAKVRAAVMQARGWVAEGSDAAQTAVIRASDEVDVEHARLVLDETVATLT